MSLRKNIIKLGERFEKKYALIKNAEDMSADQVRQIIVNASSGRFMIGNKTFIQELNSDNIFADTTISWEGFFSPQLTVGPFIFNPSVPKEIQQKYSGIPEAITSYLRRYDLGISGGPWNVRFPSDV
jgi:hypothetical protein